MRLVVKFGGGLLTSGEQIRKSAELVKEQVIEGHNVVVVVSAMRGVTDTLLETLKGLTNSRESEADSIVKKLCEKLRESHLSASRISVKPNQVSEVESLITDLVDALADHLSRFASGDHSAARMDEIASMGERLSAPLFAHSLLALDVPATPLCGGDAGIITDSNYGNALPKMELCQRLVEEKLGSIIGQGITPVVTGFVARDESGSTTTLGRGGSDYTASILGSCLKADEVWIWKDVGGIMTANPRIVDDARTIPNLSYSEAAELAHFGAEVLHPKTMEPAMQSMTPIRVKDATNPQGEGTLISKHSHDIPSSVKAVTSIDRVGIISISGAHMAGVPGVAARVFDSIARGNANVMMISQSSSETNITIVVPSKDIPICRRQLDEEFGRDEIVRDIQFDEDIAIISVVGSGMRGTPGVAAKVFRAVADVGINVIMIAQGSSEYNISFVVRKDASDKAVLAIHREFKLNELFPP